MSGNKTNNGVHEIGTDEIRSAYENDTPGQAVEKFIKEQEKAYKKQTIKAKKHFSQVFDNPLKGFPYNEDFVVTEEAVKEFGDLNEKLDLVLTVRGDKNVALAKRAMKKFKGISVKRQGKVKSGEVITFAGDEKQLQKMQSHLTGNIKGLDMVSTHEELEEDADVSLKKKAEKTGMPFGILKQVYKRGVAAWRTGHRPGTSPEQWGHARVNSFATKSKGTWGGADKDLAAKV